MKIVYIANNLQEIDSLKRTERTFLALRQDNWDDFTYKTYFQAKFIVDGEEIEIDSVRIIVENEKTTYVYFNQLIQQGWNGVFPIEGVNYVSVPSSDDFYKVIDGKLGTNIANNTAEILRDAGYMVNVIDDENAKSLVNSDGFRTSLQRESGSIKAFEDGWKFLKEVRTRIEDFSFRFQLRPKEDPLEINFKLNSNILPYDINILVGPNGVGKSQALQNLAESLLKIERGAPSYIEKLRFQPFTDRPTVSHIIVISYSPFEEFILDIDKYNLTDKEVYKYFGFRKRKTQESGKTSIGISRNQPAHDSVESLLKCIQEDQDLGYISDWVNKVNSANAILHSAICYDSLAIEIAEDATYDSIVNNPFLYADPVIKIDKKTYLPIKIEMLSALNPKKISDIAKKTRGVVFIKDNDVVYLSSGQRLFSYIVINILGSIKKNSLLLIDEPELFLHPNLEVSYLALLKSVLNYFNSKAIIATHSLVAVREVPRKCVHVFIQSDAGTITVSPPFETFGGDMQRISSYVFGDKSVTKPFEEWLNNKVNELGSPRAVIETFADEINEETILYLRSMEH